MDLIVHKLCTSFGTTPLSVDPTNKELFISWASFNGVFFLFNLFMCHAFLTFYALVFYLQVRERGLDEAFASSGFFIGWVVTTVVYWSIFVKRHAILDNVNRFKREFFRIKTSVRGTVDRKITVYAYVWLIFVGVLPVLFHSVHNLLNPFSPNYVSGFFSDPNKAAFYAQGYERFFRVISILFQIFTYCLVS